MSHNQQVQPLLIDCHKIISWLEQRRKLHKNWYEYEKASSQKIKLLLKDYHKYSDEGSIEQLLPYIKQNIQNFCFVDVSKFVGLLLKSKWAQNKSLVFGYSDPRVKQWVNLKKFMQNKQISIVNTAKFINQGLLFDLPSLDKNVELLDNQISNLKRKIDFNSNTIYQQQKEQVSQKKKIGLEILNDKGQIRSVGEQIPDLIKSLPALFYSVQQKVRNIKFFYQFFINYCESCELKNMKLEVLEDFILNGNNFVKNLPKNRNQFVVNFDNSRKYQSFYNWKPFNQWGIEIQNNSQNYQNHSFETILESRLFRLELIQDLNQILYFFQGLKYEQQNKSSNMATISSQSNISLVQSQIDSAIKQIQQIIVLVNGTIATRIQLKNSSKAYQILLRKFRNYEQNIEQIKKKNQQYEIQIQELRIQREKIVGQLRKLRNKLVQCKNECEKYLSQFIKREIRITGEINKLQ